MSTGGGAFGRPPPSHHPPIRDASTLKYVLYGPGHEKYPSWPMPAAAEVPVAIRAPPTGGSQRSKSWTDHTNYPKEQVIQYTRPYMKRSNSSQPQQLKTVLERCEKKNFDSIQYLHTMDRRKSTNSNDYSSQSPPERDQQKRDMPKMVYKSYSKESITPLTQADLEEYTKKFDETTLIQHQKQSSYAQSEGYHSYVSSSDSSSTPFIDSLRRDIDASVISMSHVSSWDGESTVTTRSGSVSSSETLKWHGSLSDMSDVSNSSATSPRQLIVHSARVQTPQKQNSESVLYMARTSTLPDRSSIQRTNLTSTLPSHRLMHHSTSVFPSPVPPRKTVAECINIYEGKNIKAIQKKALLSFYERHHDQAKRDITRSQSTTMQPSIQMNMMRQSSVEPPSSKRLLPQKPEAINPNGQMMTCDSPNSIFQGPVIMGPSISLDEWVPERPPKNRQLLMPMSPDTSSKPQRLSRPSLPLLSPSINSADSDILFKYDDPFVPSPEQDKEFRQFAQRMAHDNFNQPGEPQMINKVDINTSGGQIKKVPELPLHKSSSTPRKFINPYIKSTNMKYDMHHKLDQLHSKHVNGNQTSMQDILMNNMTNCKDAVGHYRAEVINRNHVISERDLKKSHKVLENIKYVQSKCDQQAESYGRPYEMVGGPYRAEPVNLQTDRHILPYGQLDCNRNLSEKCIQNPGFNPGPPPVGPKIFRSKSESHYATSGVTAHSPSNSFSKSTPQNQSIRRKSSTESTNTPANQKLLGTQDNSTMKETWTSQPVLESNLMRLSVDNVVEQDPTPVINAINDDRPPLPEKKRNLVLKPDEVSIPRQASVVLPAKPPTPVQIELEMPVEPSKVQLDSSESSNTSNEPILNTSKTDAVVEDIAEKDEIEDCVLESVPILIEQPDVTQSCNIQVKRDQIAKLHTRQYLPEEIRWNNLWTNLLQKLAEDHTAKTIISELEEYNNTAQDIVNMFAVDVDDLTTNDEALTSNAAELNVDVETNHAEETFEPEVELLISETSDSMKVEDCLNFLIAALQKQGDTLEQTMKANEEVGMKIVNALQEPHSTRLNRLMTEIGLIISLMFGLMSRYNRITKSLRDMTPQHQNKSVLESELVRLTEKLEDAKALKKNIDNSRAKLLPVLQTELKDLIHSYNHFMTTKIRLVIYMRDVKDRIDIAKRLKSAFNQEILDSQTV